MKMKRASIVMALAALAAIGIAAATLLSSPESAQAAPRSFFGIVPQASLSEEDASYMRAARIGSVRLPIGWESVQPTKRGGYNWEGTDREVSTIANQGLEVLPFLSGVPRWVSHRSVMWLSPPSVTSAPVIARSPRCLAA